MASSTGKWLRCYVNTSTPFPLGVTEWSCQQGGDTLDGTTADSNGFDDPDTGVGGLTATIRFIIKAANGAAPVIRRGMLFANVSLKANRNVATPDYFMPVAIVTDEGRTVRVKGQIEGTFTVRSKGTYAVDGVTPTE